MTLCVADEAEDKGPSSSTVEPVKEEAVKSVEQPKEEEKAASKIYYDVVNVSEGFQLRTAYKKKVKPSKLDGLLERRVKQFTLEEKQRLERVRQAALMSKIPATKTNVGLKTEGSTLDKQQPAVTPCVKAEEKEENLHVKDNVVKKLDFEQEAKMDNVDVKSEPTATNHSKETEMSAVQSDSGDALTHKEVNGGPLANSNNCISEAMENKEKTQKPEVTLAGENPKKRGFEEMEKSSGQSVAENMEVEQSKSSPVQVNGQAIVPVPTGDSARVPDDIKPVKSLMNGGLSQNDVSDSCHPPPLKVPKLENHVAEKGDALGRKEDVAVDSEETTPAKLLSSSTSCVKSNSSDNCSGSEGLNTTTAESQSVPTTSSVTKPDGTPQAASGAVSSVTTTSSSTSSSTTQSSASAPVAVVSQRSKHLVADTKTGSAAASSMTISKEYSTRDRVSLLRFSKCKKPRSGTALPSYRKFVTKSSKKSIFVLPNDDLKRLARRGAIREVPIFNYNAKPALDIWPYPSPRPTFGITWRFVTHEDLCCG